MLITITKHLHLSLMLISVIFLIVRVIAATVDAAWLQKKWAKIAPHMIDTCLLISAVVLMVIIQQYPIVNHWLSAKVIALFGYIGFGFLAFKGQKPLPARLAYLFIALGFIGYMISVAVTKNPLPW